MNSKIYSVIIEMKIFNFIQSLKLFLRSS